MLYIYIYIHSGRHFDIKSIAFPTFKYIYAARLFFYGNALKSKFITENVNINENLDIKIELVYIGEVHLFFFPLCIIWIEIARCICGVCSLNRATFKCNLIRIDRQNSNLKLN